MVRPSNPKLMSRVLEAVTHLGDSKGSSVRDILQLVKKGSNGHTRNVTMQVQRALKHAVTAGILRHKNGRYKAAIALAPVTQSKRRRNIEDYKIVEESIDLEESPNSGVDPHAPVQDRRRRRKGGRRRRRSRRRGGKRRRRSTNEEYEDMVPSDRRKYVSKSRIREEESSERRPQLHRSPDKYSDVSENEHESRYRSRKSKPDNSHASMRSTSRTRPKEEVREKSSRRSSSRHRSQSRTNQPPIEDSDLTHAMDCEDVIGQNGPDDTKNCGSESSFN